jgi:hypothetical protein
MRVVPTADEWQAIRTFLDPKEAEVACALLRSEGLECYVQGAQHRSMLGMLGAFIQPRLMVRGEDAVRARALLEGSLGETDDDKQEKVPASECFPEEAALRTLVVDLEALSVFTLGAGASRQEIEEVMGEQGQERKGEGGLALLFVENGAILFLDRDERMTGFMIVVAGGQATDMCAYPGFWEPGGTIVPPNRQKLVQVLGEPSGSNESDVGMEMEWRRGQAQVRATFAKGALELVEVDFAGG